METLSKIQTLVASMTVDADKVYKKGNRSASIRARKNAQEVKQLLGQFRREILTEIKRQKGDD